MVPNAGMRVAITAGCESTNLQGSSQITGFMKDESEFKQLLRDAGKNDPVMRQGHGYFFTFFGCSSSQIDNTSAASLSHR